MYFKMTSLNKPEQDPALLDMEDVFIHIKQLLNIKIQTLRVCEQIIIVCENNTKYSGTLSKPNNLNSCRNQTVKYVTM